MTDTIDPINLARALVRLDTAGPEAREQSAVDLLAPLLAGAGFSIETHDLSPGRPSLIARLGAGDALPLVFSGHLDTVPLGATSWRHPPHGAVVADGALHGRGSADMKGGVAAMVAAAVDVARAGTAARPLVLVLTAGEETGCLGAIQLRDRGVLPRAAAVLIAEPTGNRLAVGHRGALWLRAGYEGRGAHGSMPHLGVNAIYAAAEGIGFCRALRLPGADLLLGAVSLNVGTMTGGANVNSVPDRASFTIDIRSVRPGTHADLRATVAVALGAGAAIETLIDLPAVRTTAEAPFARHMAALAAGLGLAAERGSVPYFTDGSILAEACDAPTIIVGPGEPGMAHQTDESCPLAQILAATDLYRLAATQRLD